MPEPQTVQELYQFTREALNAIVDKVGRKFRVIETRLTDLEKRIDDLTATAASMASRPRAASHVTSKPTTDTPAGSFSLPTAPASTTTTSTSATPVAAASAGDSAPKTQAEREELMKALKVIESL